MENLSSAKVVYKDITNGNRIVQVKNISGQENIPVSLNFYKQQTPVTYQFKGFGRFDHQLKNGDVNVIYVKPRHASASNQHHERQGSITVDYIDANNQLVGHKTLTGTVNHAFNVNRCKASVPADHQFVRILTGANIHAFKASSQIMMVEVKKIQQARLVVRFMYGNQFIGDLKTKVVVGKPVDMDRYIRMVPAGYRFDKVAGTVPKVIKHDQTVNVQILPKQTQSQQARQQQSAQQPNSSSSASQSANAADQSVADDPQKIGAILMKLAASLHDLGLSISKNKKF